MLTTWDAIAGVSDSKVMLITRETGLERIALVGGLAANRRLRARMAEVEAELGVEVRFPPTALCTDNAAMIAAVADPMLREGRVAGLELEAFSRVPLEARPEGWS